VKYLIFILIFFYPLNIFASSKQLIKNKLEHTDNMSFKFIQKIGKKTEQGECIISYSKKILCKYDDIYNKILVSNGRSLVINSKKIKNYLRYQLKDTPLNLILDKKFLLDKLDKVEIIQESDETLSFEITHNNNLLNIFFDWFLVGAPIKNFGNLSPYNFGVVGIILSSVIVNFIICILLSFNLRNETIHLPNLDLLRKIILMSLAAF